MTGRRDLILCADDFGLSPAVDAAILTLAAAGRLTATGCMMGGPALVADAPRLAALADRLDIGLHFALTDFPPLGAMPSFAADGTPPTLDDVLRRAFTGRLDYGEIKAEFGRQIDRFRRIFGRDPDFVDGHQHVHVLPTVRRALWAMFEEGRLDPRRTWVRDCHEPFAGAVLRGVSVPKALLISALSFGIAGGARRHGVAVNDGFRGITDFDATTPYADRFRRFLSGAGRRPLVMCHPASPDGGADPDDPIAAARRAEFAYFTSDRFAVDLTLAGVRLARFAEAGA
ncbi:ChbG/HpnK family deacetylase [Siculibacillus lacustris]|nr:ChbG/HpnK family deacetylase [Siculibacillus lacustris]